MGGHFGELAKIRGLVTFRLSPFEQRALAGIFSNGIPNTIRRIRSQVLIVVPPLVLCYLVYDQTEKYHQQLMRKNPADYANDV